MSFSAKHNLTNTERFFWLLQFIFWFSNWTLQILIYKNHLHCYLCFLRHILSYLFAFSLSLVLRHYYKKYKIYDKSLFSIISVIILSSFVCGLIWIIYVNFQRDIFAGELHFYFNDFLKYLWYNILSSVYPFFAWSSIYLGYKIYEESDLNKQNAQQAISLAQVAQLEMLRYQLNPHFLFNTLSSLRALIRNKENNVAEEMVTKISEFLKYSLLEGEDNKVPLAKEIKIIRHYFDIEKVRFKDQLEVKYDISPESEEFPIPVFLIHPLIENAVKHGMKTSPAPLKIEIRTAITDGNLTVDVVNSGSWVENKTTEDSTGTGLQNTKKRLEIVYPHRHIFKINADSGSVNIHLQINKESD